MGKNPAKSSSDRREPYNQPIKIYGVSEPEGAAPLRRVMDEFRRGLRDERLGRSINARVGNSIGYRRTRAGLSVEQFARRLKMSAARLKRIEAGKESVTLSLVQRIAASLGCYLNCELI